MINLDRLLSQLMVSGLQQKDNPLFQVISQLIGYLRQIQSNTNIQINQTSSDAKNLDYLTWSNEHAELVNSRQLLAGVNVLFNDTISGERTVNVTGFGGNWDVLTDGFESEPELIYAGGEVIMLHTP
jgi:hypothetical protein